MKWTNPQSLKAGFIITLLCFLSSTIGSSLSMMYFMAYQWPLQIGIALLVSYSISTSLFYVWGIVLFKYKLQLGVKHSHTGHLVSITIMMLVSYLILYAWPDVHATHLTHNIEGNSIASLYRMLITMCIGFLFALPYNVYNAGKSASVG